MPRKIRDAKIQNSRYGRQERLMKAMEKKFAEEEVLLDDTHEDYCASCGMNISVQGSCDCERDEEP